MQTPFLGDAYAGRSPVLSNNTAINIFPEVLQDKTTRIGAFLGTPGLATVYQGTANEVRGLWKSDTQSGSPLLFAVIGSKVLRFDTLMNATDLGDLPNYTGRVSIVDNGTQVAFAHADGWHYAAFTDTSIRAVPNAPKGSILTATDNYVAFTNNIDGQFGITALGDLSSIDPLDVASAEGWPDNCVAVVADHRQLWLFGTETIEIWEDTGNQFFPFEQAPGGFIQQGLNAKFSVAQLDNSIFWMGADRSGDSVIYRSNGYVPQRISTHAIEYYLNQAETPDAIGFAYQEEGHSFYFLTLPGLNLTFCYDVATGLWHQRAYQGVTQLERHRANCSAFFNGNHLIGDYARGKIYRMAMDLTTDDGQPIYRERTWSLAENQFDIEHKRVRIDAIELHLLTGQPVPIVETGTAGLDTQSWGNAWSNEWSAAWGQQVAGTDSSYTRNNLVWFQISRDSGRTWTFRQYRDVGPFAQRKKRAVWRRQGLGRDVKLRVATDMNAPMQWVGAYVKGEVLAV